MLCLSFYILLAIRVVFGWQQQHSSMGHWNEALQSFSIVFTARSSYASAVLVIVILFVCPSVRPSHACFVMKPKNLLPIF